jgi:hypothetical protein
MINCQNKGLKRNTIDKYYTKCEIVDRCVNIFKEIVQTNDDDLIIEPSAGNGSFIESIKSLTYNYLFYDLHPENEEIIEQDYLELDASNFMQFNQVHIIGNPPFGRQSSLALKFIKKSTTFCNTISFILPKSFKKDSLKKKFPLDFHLVYEEDLPSNAFLVNEEEYDVPCVFQIWQKKEFYRIPITKLEPYGFKFVKKDENPDISFRRVGVNAGTIDTNIEEKSIQSHYFIKFVNNKSLGENLCNLYMIHYEFNNTVGPKSISKQELISKFNNVL